MCHPWFHCFNRDAFGVMHSSSISTGLCGSSSNDSNYSYYYYCYNPRLYNNSAAINGFTKSKLSMCTHPWWINRGKHNYTTK